MILEMNFNYEIVLRNGEKMKYIIVAALFFLFAVIQ